MAEALGNVKTLKNRRYWHIFTATTASCPFQVIAQPPSPPRVSIALGTLPTAIPPAVQPSFFRFALSIFLFQAIRVGELTE